jgi:FlaA1/EpsC-like NDP-sugar epimerase
VLIYGAGRMGTSVVRELLSKPDASMRPIGFIDDHPGRAGKVFNGYPVFGSLETLEAVIARHRVKGVIIATRKLPAERLRAAALTCERTGIWMRYFRVRFDDRSGFPETRKAPAVTA